MAHSFSEDRAQLETTQCRSLVRQGLPDAAHHPAEIIGLRGSWSMQMNAHVMHYTNYQFFAEHSHDLRQ
jgi:hypothetical protein